MAEQEEEKYFVKKFKGTLVLDWKAKTMRITKKKPTNVKPYEIPVTIDIDVLVPHVPDIVAKGKFVVNPAKVEQMIIEQI